MPSKWCICGNFTYNKLDGVTKYCKVAILGDKGCGKSALVQAYLAEAIEQVSTGCLLYHVGIGLLSWLSYPGLGQRPYIIKMLHSYILPM